MHCRAGLGRTGTLIACYIINNFSHTFSTPKSVISWLRIARPGSVIGIQQQFLVDKFDYIKKLKAQSLHKKQHAKPCRRIIFDSSESESE